MEQVRSGASADLGELANDVLRSLGQPRSRPFKVTPELEAWLLAAADQDTTPLAREDFNGIREKIQARLHGSQQ